MKWTRDLSPDYSAADGYVLKYAIRGASALDVIAETDTDGVGFAVTISAGDTGPLIAGQYEWRSWVELDGEVFPVSGGPLTIEANFATAAAGDLQSSAEVALALVDAQIAELLASPNESYAIGGSSAQKRKLEDLNRQRGILVARLGRLRGQELPSYAMTFRAPS